MGNFKKQNFDAPTRRVGMLRGDQVGERLWMYAWYHFADVKNSKLFLLGFVRFRASQPNGLGCSEVTKSAVPPHEKERPAVQASQSF
ncbi:MAG: hypothetical protein IJW34_02735 [Clostridia bacterium]|nr:hypothetical protein [Clostridia bacterium]